MIKLKELVNRVYDGKSCIRFEYDVKDEDDSNFTSEPGSCFVARFQRNKENSRQWKMQIVIPRDRDCDSQVYTFDYILPKEDMDLVLIAAIGLKCFQLRIKEEVQLKSDWDFILGALLKDI